MRSGTYLSQFLRVVLSSFENSNFLRFRRKKTIYVMFAFLRMVIIEAVT